MKRKTFFILCIAVFSTSIFCAQTEKSMLGFEGFIPLKSHESETELKDVALKWISSAGVGAENFPRLDSRRAVWHAWDFEYRNYARPDYAEERKIDLIYAKRLSSLAYSQAFDVSAAIFKEDFCPAATILRRSRALAEHLLKECGDFAAAANAVLPRIIAMQEALKKNPPTDEGARAGSYYAACALRRELALSNPKLKNVRDLLVVSRGLYEGSVRTLNGGGTKDDYGGHFVTQYFGYNALKGGGIYRIKNYASGVPWVENILANSIVQNGRFAGRKLDFGAFATPDVSFDGKKIAFAWTSNSSHALNEFTEDTCLHIFRVNADGSDLRQLTDGAFNDFDPCFLPNGRMVFISERRGGYIRCFPGYIKVPNYTMFSMDADGKDIIPMSFFETAEWNPAVCNDGMLLFTRWDYVDRENCLGSRLWLANPDGTNPRAPHGNYPYPFNSDADGEQDFKERFPTLSYGGMGSRANSPLVELGARQIPFSRKYVFTAAPHHGAAFGSLCILDLSVSDDGNMSQIRRITPQEFFPESEIPSRRMYKYGAPWPLDETFYICNAWENIVLLDKFGNEELLCDLREVEATPDDRFRLSDPIPLAARLAPPALPARTRFGSKSDGDPKATISVINVYDADMPLPAGVKIKWMRIIQNCLKSTHAMGVPMIGFERENSPRIPLGIVPVEEDGSVYFEAPVAKELIFQILDEEFSAVHSMRSVAFVFPGEQLSCAGCHEPIGSAVKATKRPMALRRPPSKIMPEMQKIEPISYYVQIRPVLEKAGLYDSAKTAEENYQALRDDVFWFSGGMCNNMVGLYCKARGGSRTVAGKFGGRVSKLYNPLNRAAADGRITLSELRLVTLWMDCNSPRLGAYENEAAQLKGEVVLPHLDFDPANPIGTEFEGKPLKGKFWHDND